MSVTTQDILSQAAKHVFLQVGDWISMHPAEVNLGDAKGWTVLHHAAAAESAGKDVEDIVLLLMQAGADPHQGDVRGETPFNIAAANAPVAGRLMTLHWLDLALQGKGTKGLNDISGSHGSTLAQYMAKWLRDDEIEQCLREAVEAGMKPDVPNAAGWTPLTAAAAMGRAKAVEAFIWHYGYDGVVAKTTEPYEANYKGMKVLFPANSTAADVAWARLGQDKNLSPDQKSDYVNAIAIIFSKISGQ